MPARLISAAVVAAMLLVAPAAICARQQARDDENLIRGLLRDRLYEVAADRIFDFVFKYPQHPRREPLLFQICEILMREGNATKSIPLLRCYLQEFPDGPRRRPVSLMLARARIAVGDYAPAVALLTGILADPGHDAAGRAAAREMLARLYLLQERFEDTVALLRDVGRGASPTELLTLARALRKLGAADAGRLEEAEAVLLRLLAARGAAGVAPQARAELAALYVEAARYQDCLRLLSDWTPGAGEGELAVLERGLVLALAVSYYHLGDYAGAYETLRPLARGDRRESDAASQMPAVLMSLDEWGAVADLLATRYREDPETLPRARLGRMLGNALIEAMRTEEATEVLVELAGEEADPYGRAELLLRAAEVASDPEHRVELAGEAGEAAEEAASPAALAEALLLRAALQRGLGRRREALETLERVEALPESARAAEAAEAAGEILLGLGDYEGAEAALHRAVGAGSPSAVRLRAYPALVRCLRHLRRPREAVGAFENLLELAPPGSLAARDWGEAAAAWAMTGNGKGASDAALQALLSSDGPAAADYERLLLFAADQALVAGDLALAEAIYDRLRGNNDGSIRLAASVGLVAVAIAGEAWEQVVERCRLLAAEEHGGWESDWALFATARSLERLGRREESASVLQGLAAARPPGPFAAAAVEEVQRRAVAAGRHEEALRADSVFNSLDPDSQYRTDRLLIQAQRAFLAGRIGEAVTLYRRHPHPTAMPTRHRFLFAQALYQSNAYQEAYPILASLDPEPLRAPQRRLLQRMLARILLDGGQADEALAFYRRLLDEPLATGSRLEVLLGAAGAAEAAGRWPEAQELYCRYVEESRSEGPDLERMLQVAEAFAAHEDLLEAAELYGQLRLLAASQEEAARFGFSAAELLERAGQDEQAAEEFLAIAYQHLDLAPWPARGRLRAAAIYERLGSLDAAERQYQVVAESYPDTEEGRAAAESLRALWRLRERIQEEQIQPPA